MANTGAFVNVNGTQYAVLAPGKSIAGFEGIPLTRQLNRNFGQSVGLSINIPIFNQYTTRTQWQRAKIAITQNELVDEQEKVNLKNNIYNAYQNAFASYQKYNASVRTVEASQKAFDFSKKRYDIGLLGTLDFIITQGNLFRARVEELSNRYDYIFQMKVLEFYKGQGLRL
jgi:outer membrane protein